jgi:DNA-binding HxlR family transcriptional regulator
MGGKTETNEIDTALADLLQKKGTLEMLVEIGENTSQRHTDLRDELLLSSSTIQQRLKDGKKLNLWEQTLEDRGNVAAKVYQLTSLGESLYESAVDKKLHSLYRSKRGIIRAIDNRERRIIIESSPSSAEWLSEISMEEHDIEPAQKFIDQFK